MVIAPFSVGRLPRVEFGEGTFAAAPGLVADLGRRVLIVTGARSFAASSRWIDLTTGLDRAGVEFRHVPVEDEPSPDDVDRIVGMFRGDSIEVVLAVGGGSALDAGKAVAALLPHGNSVLDHLEGVGTGHAYRGPSLPCVAIPTTAGTGAEATRNSVLSRRGPAGFKKSFRHDELTPRYAVVDPELLHGCPKAIVGSSGMDAVTQLVEAYVSSRASRFTDALVLDAVAVARDSLLPWFAGGNEARGARAGMAYAALASGIALSHAGLGAVHGLASPLGALFPLPHGVACGTLLASSVEANLQALRAREPRNPALGKYARLGAVLSGANCEVQEESWEALVATLTDWTNSLGLPRLGRYGVRSADLSAVVRDSRPGSMRTNPIVLTDAELVAILERRL